MTKTRTYLKTHSWLKFSLDLRQAPAFLWIKLGECQSKCENISGVPLRPQIAKELHQLFLAKGVLATTSIEGNTLTEEEVKRHLEGKLKLPPSREYLAQEIDNIIRACNQIVAEVQQGIQKELSVAEIKGFNQLVLHKLSLSDGVIAGKIRTYKVGVAQYLAVPPEDCEYLLERLCQWLNSKELEPFPDMPIVNSIFKALLAHLYLAWIHPFGDGNGRTARLVEYKLLINSGIPAPAAHLLSNHYNQTRTEYYRQLDRASKSGGDVIPFLNYAVQGFLDGLMVQLKIIQSQQLDVTWRSFIQQSFLEKKSTVRERQRNLILELSTQEAPIPFSKVMEISPKIATAYFGKAKRTLSRDLAELIKMDLLKIETDGYIANKEIIHAFLPIKAQK